MGTIIVTGAASGICAATARRLCQDGHKVIGIDIRSCDIVADLSDSEGRAQAISEAINQSGGVIDGLVSGAGLGPFCETEDIISVDYFGRVGSTTIRRDCHRLPGISRIRVG